VIEKAWTRRNCMNLDELLSQIQNMRTALGCSAALRRLAQLQQQADEAPSPQHQLEIMATFCTELATSLEELQATITEHQQANTGLRQTNDHLELALMAVNGIIYDWEIEQRTLFRTQGLVEILGYRPEEAEPTLKWWTQRIHPDDRQRVRQHISNALANNSDFALEYRVRHKSDRYLYVWDKGLIIRNAAGKAVRVVGSTIDISERKQAEAALREQTQFLRNVIDTNPNLICVKDWESKFTLSNQALADLYGTTVEDIIGKTDADFNPDPTQVEQYLRDDRQVISTLQPKFIPEEAITSATGEIRWLQTIKKPLLSGDGQTCNHVLAVATDITDRIQAEEEAQRSAAEITQLFNMLPCFVWKFCPATNEFIYATEIMTELSGISREAFFRSIKFGMSESIRGRSRKQR
jgi:PAS domain S-box-containing protein